MILQEIAIHHFRSFRDERIAVEPVTALIGPNGSGKSNVIHALDFFYTRDFKLTPECFYGRDTSEPLSVTLTFGDLRQEETEIFAPYIDHGVLSVTREGVWSDSGGTILYHGTRLQCSDFAEVRQLTGSPKKQQYNELAAAGAFPGLERVTKIDDVEGALARWEASNPDRCERQRDLGQFFGWQNVGYGRIDRFSKWLFIPAVRDPAAEGIEGRGNALKELLDMLLRGRLQELPELVALREHAAAEFQRILDPANIGELRQLSTALTERLGQFAPGVNVEVGWQNLGNVSITFPTATTRLGEGDFLAPVEYAGHGTQRAFLIAILQHLVHSRISADAGDGQGTPNLLLGIEEPELYLHPVRARLMNHVLRVLSQAREGEAPIQTIYATHSPFFTDVRDFPSVRLVRRGPGEPGQPAVSTVRQADEAALAETLANAHGRDPNEFNRASLQARLATIMTPEVSEGYFADAVVLVEGEEDAAVIRGAALMRGVVLTERGIAVLPVDGKTNLDRPLAIFTSFGIPCFTLFDADADKPTDKAHFETNRALLTLLHRLPEDRPATAVWENGACFAENFGKTMRDEIGLRFDETVLAEAARLGYDEPHRGRKNPIVLEAALRQVCAAGLPRTLDSVLNAVIALVPARA